MAAATSSEGLAGGAATPCPARDAALLALREWRGCWRGDGRAWWCELAEARHAGSSQKASDGIIEGSRVRHAASEAAADATAAAAAAAAEARPPTPALLVAAAAVALLGGGRRRGGNASSRAATSCPRARAPSLGPRGRSVNGGLRLRAPPLLASSWAIRAAPRRAAPRRSARASVLASAAAAAVGESDAEDEGHEDEGQLSRQSEPCESHPSAVAQLLLTSEAGGGSAGARAGARAGGARTGTRAGGGAAAEEAAAAAAAEERAAATAEELHAFQG